MASVNNCSKYKGGILFKALIFCLKLRANRIWNDVSNTITRIHSDTNLFRVVEDIYFLSDSKQYNHDNDKSTL
jgi:hypothetical protein